MQPSFPVSGWYVPSLQSAHIVSPIWDAYWPARHATHVVSLVSCDEQLPSPLPSVHVPSLCIPTTGVHWHPAAMHGETVEPVVGKEDGHPGEGVGGPDSASQDDEGVEYLPAIQAMHVVSLVCPAAAVEYLPSAQAMHVVSLVCPDAAVEYLPFAHMRQTV